MYAYTLSTRAYTGGAKREVLPLELRALTLFKSETEEYRLFVYTPFIVKYVDETSSDYQIQELLDKGIESLEQNQIFKPQYL